MTTIIIPSRFADIFEDCKDSLNRFAPEANKILVRDGDAITPPEGWTTIQGPTGGFVYSRNVNMGIKACTGNVLLMNDDCLFTSGATVEKLERILENYPDI